MLTVTGFVPPSLLALEPLTRPRPAGRERGACRADCAARASSGFRAFSLALAAALGGNLAQGQTTELVSMATGGMQGNGVSDWSSISADGRFVAFKSLASNLVVPDTNGTWDVFVRDLQLGTTERVSEDSFGVQANAVSGDQLISANGRFVAFDSLATNLVGLDTNGARDVFVHDRQLDTTERVSLATGGAQGNGFSRIAFISGDGRFVAFSSLATNLVASDTNGFSDSFVRDRGQPGVAYCFGDGIGTPCPCGNNGSAGNGCANSLNASGANLATTGTASIAFDTLVLHGIGMPNSSALYFQGTTQTSVPFGDGLRCAGGAVMRLGTKTNVAGASSYPGVVDLSISVRGAVTSPGTRTYQIWYRNSDPLFCPPSGFNLSNGFLVTWC